MTKSYYDALGRIVRQYQNYINGNSQASGSQDIVTNYRYDGLNHVRAILSTNVTPSGSYSTTRTSYTYGGNGSVTNDLLTKVTYNDGTSESYQYNNLGEQTLKVERSGVTHHYIYDALGRLRDDWAEIPASSGVDTAISDLNYEYDALGRLTLATSKSGLNGTIINQVKDEYNGLGQLIKEYQEHNGAVTSGSYKVQYLYDTQYASSGNYSRLSRLVYPDGRVLWYSYNSGVDANIGRVSWIADGTNASVGQVLERYTYLGLDTVAVRTLDEAGVTETTTLNNFDQVQNVNWVQGGTSLDQFSYAYDRNGNMISRTNQNYTIDNEIYTYDKLNRLTDFTVSPIGSNPDGKPFPSEAHWNLDSNGNRYGDKYGSAFSSVGESQATTTAYNSAGYNTTVTYTVYSTNYTVGMKYDAWGRLAQTLAPGGIGTIAYGYDALGRQISSSQNIVIGAMALASQSFYDGNNVIEERNACGTVLFQYVWSGAGGNRLVLRDQPSATVSRVYALMDAAGNVTSTVGFIQPDPQQPAGWKIIERYLYDVDGRPTVVQRDWSAFGSGHFAQTTVSWDWFSHGMRWREMFLPLAWGDSPLGLYQGSGGHWYDPQYGRTLTPDLSALATHEPPYNGHPEDYTSAFPKWYLDATDVFRQVAAPVVTVASLVPGPQMPFLLGAAAALNGANAYASGYSIPASIGIGSLDLIPIAAEMGAFRVLGRALMYAGRTELAATDRGLSFATKGIVFAGDYTEAFIRGWMSAPYRPISNLPLMGVGQDILERIAYAQRYASRVMAGLEEYLPGMGAYKNVGGHHPLSGRAFDYEKYRDALSIGKNEMLALGWGHPQPLTQYQREAYIAFGQTGESLTITRMAQIEIDAMVKAGIPREYAQQAVSAAIWERFSYNQYTPKYIPWVGPNPGVKL